MKPPVTAAEFLRTYRHLIGPMTVPEAKRAVERIERRSQYVTLAEQRAYELARDAPCRLCLGLPVVNAMGWIAHRPRCYAACPRCGSNPQEGHVNANANNPRRLAVEQAAADKTRATQRAAVETYIALQKRVTCARLALNEAYAVSNAATERAQVALTEAIGALERYLDDLGVSR